MNETERITKILTHPLTMGVLIKNNGKCEFFGRKPTKKEKKHYVSKAKELQERRTHEHNNTTK